MKQRKAKRLKAKALAILVVRSAQLGVNLRDQAIALKASKAERQIQNSIKKLPSIAMHVQVVTQDFAALKAALDSDSSPSN